MKAVVSMLAGAGLFAGGLVSLGASPMLALAMMGAGAALGLFGLVENHRDHVRR